MTHELKPCPFCGEQSVATAGNWAKGIRIRLIERSRTSVFCLTCGGSGPAVSLGEAENASSGRDEAVERWNQRAPSWQPLDTHPPDSTLEDDTILVTDGKSVAQYHWAYFDGVLKMWPEGACVYGLPLSWMRLPQP